MRKLVEDERILELVERGLSICDIARETNITSSSVGRRVERLGIKKDVVKKLSIDERERVFAEKLRKKYKGFHYHNGYTHSECLVNIIHDTCGKVHQRNANTIRSKNHISCPHCVKEKKEYTKKIKKEIQLMEKERKAIIKKIDVMRRALEKDLNSHKECPSCGAYFKSINRKYCSSSCYKKHENRTREVVRRKRLHSNGEVDYSITLDKLFERDDGVCHICKEEVKMNLHSNHNEYGSIDHVIPVVNGGTHTWDNVKLAHRICNTLKRDNEITIDEEMALYN